MADECIKEADLLELSHFDESQTNAVLIRPPESEFNEQMVENYANEKIRLAHSQGKKVVGRKRFSGIKDGKTCYYQFLYIAKAD
jgi:hypothetical protein